MVVKAGWNASAFHQSPENLECTPFLDQQSSEYWTCRITAEESPCPFYVKNKSTKRIKPCQIASLDSVETCHLCPRVWDLEEIETISAVLAVQGSEHTEPWHHGQLDSRNFRNSFQSPGSLSFRFHIRSLPLTGHGIGALPFGQ